MQVKDLQLKGIARVVLLVLLLSKSAFSQTRGFVSVREYAERIYVTENGSGTKSGDSWENAMDSLQLAIAIANENYNTYGNRTDVWVAEGTYYGDSIASNNAFTILAGVNVYGGFAGTETSVEERNIDVHPTILDGQNVQRVLGQLTDFTDSTMTIWDGFIIEKGRESVEHKGGGVYLRRYGTLRNCIIRNNTDSGSSASGGGVYLAYGVLENCEIYGNSLIGSTLYGGGVYSTGGSLIQGNVYNHSLVGGYSDF